MTPLSEEIVLRLNLLFKESDRAEAARLLIEDCIAEAIRAPTISETGLERCRFAILKLSNGEPKTLIDAIGLAQTDYRDLLMAAGFGEDPNVHLSWFPANR
jgi:hypothetical protein